MQFGLFYEAPEDARYTHAERYAEGCMLSVADVKRAMARFAGEVMPKV